MKTAVSSSQTSIVQSTVYSILFAISFGHMINDLLQAVVPSIYPMLKTDFRLTFTQVGLITLVFQLSASILQPFVGNYTDRRPNPMSLAIGMGFTLIGLLSLSFANSFMFILLSVALIGIGSSVFHPEASRVAQMASGGKKGLAQSIFQVGGNAGSAIGPLLAALIIVPHGQRHIQWFCLIALLGIIVLSVVGRWYKVNLEKGIARKKVQKDSSEAPALSKNTVIGSIVILLVLIFSKYFYMASMTSYFTFYLIEKFGVTVPQSQFYLFAFLAAVAVGTILGGPLGDRYGRKLIIWVSILGAAPFTLLLPYMGLTMTVVLAIIIGIIISSAFSAILVYATDLVPGKVGMIAGLFFGFAFGMGGIGSALLGWLADRTSIEYIFHVCSYLPLIGIVTGFLPNIKGR
ncbi:MFS transporter [Sphingobacterium wenxiniae]|uniref:MFS transporter, FSR family, fosmidomycin resistance protein n=1 Tax=Sphingobacterium wenxiniae TaxID=683125 RepID=A0A1I6S3K6_9SPHI|nr:MFS transporter [Sphingobacterium wenxiniae]SFS71519.1 MFS transporter, FSR family, fosmidomycin resistance protein [Sphingobacterium wenxiniae]